MRKRVYIALAVALVMLAGVIGWQVYRASREREPKEPVYQGKRLSVWLEILFGEGASVDDNSSVQAIRHIGTNALPVLIKRLRAPQDTSWKKLMMALANAQNLVPLHPKSAEFGRWEAIFGYEALGSLASGQVPSLSDTLTNDPSPIVRQAAASALGYIGTNARLAAPALFRATKDTDDGVRYNAFWALSRIVPDSYRTIPVLVAGLDDPCPVAQQVAATALAKYGSEARAAVPALLRMLATNNNPAGIEQRRLHMAAGGALKAIDPEAAAKAGVK